MSLQESERKPLGQSKEAERVANLQRQISDIEAKLDLGYDTRKKGSTDVAVVPLSDKKRRVLTWNRDVLRFRISHPGLILPKELDATNPNHHQRRRFLGKAEIKVPRHNFY